MIDEKWLKGEITVNRDQFADIVSSEMEVVKKAAMEVNKNAWPFLEEFLVFYSACVAEALFRPTTEKEEKEEKERER